RALRARLSCWGDDSQQRRPERNDIQPLRGYAVLLEQLSIQSGRFNFFDFHAGESQSMSLLYNQNVTYRRRGVMEKCTYCVQRITHARINAEREDHLIRDGDIVTACQGACPADAIVFGNKADPNSRVAKLKAEPRNYGVLAELNVRPRTTYLARITNPNAEVLKL